jgi:shikimate kinase
MNFARSERIFLAGFMGSGKSTIGPILANTIGYDFVDIDHVIEQRQGKSINDIFREAGEEHFRVLERAVLGEVLGRSQIVVSLGGGTIADPGNFQRVSMSGIIVYLKATPEQIFRRLHHKLDRPVLTDLRGEQLSTDELRARIRELFVRREPFYEMADIVVSTDEQRVGVTVDRIVKRLSSVIP